MEVTIPDGRERFHPVPRGPSREVRSSWRSGATETAANRSAAAPRGYTAQFLLTTLIVMAVNLRKIDAFLDDEQASLTLGEPRRNRRKRRTKTLAEYVPTIDHDPPDA